MEQFPGNSNSGPVPPSGEPRKVEQVTSGVAIPRKRGLGRKFKEVFIGGDARGTADYVFFDVVIPAARDMLSEAIHAGFDRLIYGESPRHRRGGGGVPMGYSNAPRVNYQGVTSTTPASQRGVTPQQRSLSRQARARMTFDEIVIPNRQEAEDVLERLYDILSQYGMVSVADLCTLTGVVGTHTDMKWGWRALPGAKAQRLRNGGFVLDLPDPEPLGA